MQYDKQKYPSIALVCGMEDARLLSDRVVEEEGQEEKTVFWIGSPGDPGTGLVSFESTPNFEDLSPLETFCRENLVEYKKRMQLDGLPGLYFWEKGGKRLETEAERKVREALAYIAEAEGRLLKAEDRDRQQGSQVRVSKASAFARARAELMPVREILSGSKEPPAICQTSPTVDKAGG